MIFEMCQEESLQSLSLAFGLPNLKDGSGGKYILPIRILDRASLSNIAMGRIYTKIGSKGFEQ